jgi:LmbE family N-acetylglucosaminyl deacetylase
MFIHAHPDDEAIDFGGLMAKASRSGRSIVTILFTDGESGIISEEYQGRPPSSSELPKIRIEEARKSLSILGSRHYIRLGLENNPYSSSLQILSMEDVLDEWGGLDSLVDKIGSYIEKYSPEVIVSPDIATSANEHFEHETVGFVVKKALQKLEEKGGHSVSGHIVSIDPLQKTMFPDALAIPVMGIDPKTGLTYREIQAEALKQHETQIDACIIALERVHYFEKEYYISNFWNTGKRIEEYF